MADILNWMMTQGMYTDIIPAILGFAAAILLYRVINNRVKLSIAIRIPIAVAISLVFGYVIFYIMRFLIMRFVF